MLYRRYFGLDGMFFEYKTLASQVVTVVLQVTYKLGPLAAAVRLGAPAFLYWLFFVALVPETLCRRLFGGFGCSIVAAGLQISFAIALAETSSCHRPAVSCCVSLDPF